MSQIEKNFYSDKYIATFSVEALHEGFRLDRFVLEFYPNFSRQLIKKKIAAGEITISDRPSSHRPSSKVHKGETVTVIMHKSNHEDEYWHGEKLDIDTNAGIIWEDSDLLAAAKPAFMATHPTGSHLFNCATVFFEQKYGHTIHSIHRLDRETPGVLLLAKNPKCAGKLTPLFEKGDVKKSYFFIAMKNDDFDGRIEFSANQRLGQTEGGLKRVLIHAFPENSRDGKHASTDFTILHEEEDYVLGLAFPKTGRQHQIRVHAQVHGLPLVGDKIYLGGYEMFQRFKDGLATDDDYALMDLPRQALHAAAINIPYNGERRTFIAPVPSDFKTWIESRLSVSYDEIEELMEKKIKNYYQET